MLKLYFTVFISVLISCGKKEKPSPVAPEGFENTPVSYPIAAGNIDEASGMAESKTNPGTIWVEQDSGNPSELCAIDTNGQFIKKIKLEGITNRDWEELAVGPGPAAGKSYVYLAETGDNNQKDSTYAFYRFEEPSISATAVDNIDKIKFRYPDGSHDAEGFLLNPATKDIFIITKRDAKSKIYKLAYPQDISSTTTATSVGELSFTGVTGAAISSNGEEIIIRTYASLYYWKKNAGETLEAALQRSASTLGYQMEPQGEAVTFKLNNTGFYTLSEKLLLNTVNLNFYKRK